MINSVGCIHLVLSNFRPPAAVPSHSFLGLHFSLTVTPQGFLHRVNNLDRCAPATGALSEDAFREPSFISEYARFTSNVAGSMANSRCAMTAVFPTFVPCTFADRRPGCAC